MQVLNITIKNLFGEDIEKTLMFHISEQETANIKNKRASIVDMIGVIDSQRHLIDKHIAAGSELTDELRDELFTDEVAEAYSSMVNELREQVILGYGEPSEDGLRFIKTPEATQEFRESVMVDQIINRLLENPAEAKAFFKNMYPSAYAEGFDKSFKEAESKLGISEEDTTVEYTQVPKQA